MDKAVQLLREVEKEEPALAKPLSRAASTIDSLNNAIHNVFLQHKDGKNPSGGYKSGGPRYGGSKPGAK